jgi:putative FmdB family regulatory protein
MPIYEYQCQSCQHELEALQKVSETPLVDCPDCGEPELRKKISAAAFRLKGGGWYETDFKSSGQKNLAGDAGKDGANKSADAAAKKDTSKDSTSDNATTAS